MTFEFDSDNQQPTTIGGLLRQRREARELSVDDVAAAIKINARFLTAIEEGREQDLPADVYKDLFLKSYAEYLGLSIDQLLLRLPEQPRIVEGEALAEVDTTPKPKPVILAQQQAPLPPQKRQGRPVLMTIILVALVVLGFLAFDYYRDNFVTQPASRGFRQPPVVQDSAVTPEQVAADTLPATDSTKLAAETESTMLNILLIAKGECWLEVSIDGDSTFSELVRAADTLGLAMQDSIRLKLGRADMVDVWCDNKPLRLYSTGDALVQSVTVSRNNLGSLVDSSRLTL